MNTPEILRKSATVSVGGEQLTISEFSFTCGFRVFAQLYRLQTQLGAGVTVPELLLSGSEDLLEVVALAAGKPYEWLDTISMPEGLQLATAVIEVNRETMQKKTIPEFFRMLAALGLGVPAPAPMLAPAKPRAARKN